jgi:hypothetical protein
MMILRFITKSSILLLLVVVSSILICLLPGESFLNVFADKQQALRTTSAPRMIFVGGSSLIYGLDSPCVEAALDLPVVNSGLHGGLGLRFMLSHVRPYIQPGDILILIPEYGVLARGYGFNAPTTAALAFTDLRNQIDYLSPRDYFEAIQGFPAIAYNKIVVRPIAKLRASQNPFAYPPPFYWRGSVNRNGDIIAHLKETRTLSPEELKSYSPVVSKIDDSVVMLNEFAEYANDRGAKVFFMFTPIVDTRYRQYAPVIASIYNQLKQKMNIPIVSPPSNYMYPINYFYDSPEHLTAKGRKARTERLIADLKQIQLGNTNVGARTNVGAKTNICADGGKP